MSSRAKAWAWAIDIQPLPKLVLLALAERYSDDAGMCFPSHARLAKDTGLSLRGVKDQLKKLEEAGLIEVVRRTVDRVCQTNLYRLNIPDGYGTLRPGSASHALGGGAPHAGGSASDARGVGHQMPTEPIKENIYIAQQVSEPSSDADQNGSNSASGRTSKETKSRKTPMPADFCISERVRAWAQKNGYDQLEEHFDNFTLTCRSRGYTYVDWDSAFMRAIKDDWAKLRTPKSSGYGRAFNSQSGSPFAGAK